MAGRKKHAGGSGHGGAWIITFADLVSLLMAFFVMIVSFSNQDEQKVAQAAGSIREAFGVQPVAAPAGVIEIDGIPVRNYLRDQGSLESQAQGDSVHSTPYERQFGATDMVLNNSRGAQGELGALVSLLQAAMNDADIDTGGNVVFEERDEGLLIAITDSEYRTMFGTGSSEPSTLARLLLSRIAPALDRMPNQIRIIGHTSDAPEDGAPVSGSKWVLSTARAEAALNVMLEHGLSSDHVAAIVGMGDSEPLLPEAPGLDSNRRVAILIERAVSPYPADMTP